MTRGYWSASLSFVRDARWMTPERARAYRNIILVITPLAAIGWIALAHGGIDLRGKPIGADFVCFWTASRIALSGAPAQVYDVDTVWAAQRALFSGVRLNYTAFYPFLYPPVFLLICLPLALLPYGWSLACWLGTTGYAYWRAVNALAGRPNMTLSILAFPAVFWNAMNGQNGFLTTALFGGAVLTADARPALAGICFGCLAYKPQLAIMVPVGLIAGRHWKCLVVAAATAVTLGAVSVTVFGVATWHAFLSEAPLAGMVLERTLLGSEKMQSVFAAVRLLGGGIEVAYVLHVLVALTVGSLLAYLCRLRPMRDGGGAAMAAAALLASPYVFGYDLLLLAIPLVWILKEAHRTDFLPWEKSVLMVAFLLPVLSISVAARLHLPLAPLVIMALLGVIFRRAIRGSMCVRSAGLATTASPLGPG